MKKGFTMVEMIIVLVLMAVILSITLFVGRGYLQSVQYRQDRDLLVSALDDMVTMARTSTYYNGNYYTNLDIYITEDGFTGTVTDDEFADFGEGILVESYKLNQSEIVLPSGPMGIRLNPYALSCTIDQGGSGFQLDSTFTDLSTCFELLPDVCKFKQVQC